MGIAATFTYIAEKFADGVPINPVLPRRFDATPNDERPKSHQKWWHVPYVVTETVETFDEFYGKRTDEHAEAGRKQWEISRARWMKAYPTGTRFEVRCLDGGAWDRSTSWGMFATLEEAIDCAKNGPRAHGHYQFF